MTNHTAHRHPIGVVARRSGLSVDLIRAWERRYGVVQPHRTPGQHRLYSEDDILRLTLLRKLSLTSRRISKIAPLSTATLRQLLAQEEKVTLTLAPTEIRPSKRVTVCVKESLEAIVQLDTRSLRTLLQDAWVDHGHHAVLAEVLSPLLQHIGALWRSGDMRIMHERLASSVIRPFLNELAETYPQADEAPSMVVATPVGENHEIGALMALAVAASEGWQCTYLGPDMPAREIADASHQIGADAVALSVVNPTVGPRVMSEINALRQLLSPKVQILAGGEGARAYQDFLKKLNVTHVVDLGHFQSMISQLVEA